MVGGGGIGPEGNMDEFRTAAGVIGAVAAGYLVIGEVLAGQLHLWFGWPAAGPLSWLGGMIGWSL